jgi:hypothetical protein
VATESVESSVSQQDAEQEAWKAATAAAQAAWTSPSDEFLQTVTYVPIVFEPEPFEFPVDVEPIF